MEFFETKVIKVKKEKGVSHHCNKWFTCPICGKKLSHNYKGEKEKGNFVNGENLDEIKFPCFCSYSPDFGIGILTKIDVGGEFRYELHNIIKQNDTLCGCSCVSESNCLYEIIVKNNIHILKGKIIIFEFDKESK